MGSGGGGGSRTGCCALPGRGGNGGGIIVILSPIITGYGGQITACGENGQSAGHNLFQSAGSEGGGGGGAGGMILVVTQEIRDDGGVSFNVDGGFGGRNSVGSDRKGGNGGAGKYEVFIARGPLFEI